MLVVLEHGAEIPPTGLGLGAGEPPENWKKLEISKIKPRSAGSGAKRFRGNGPGRAYVLGEPIA